MKALAVSGAAQAQLALAPQSFLVKRAQAPYLGRMRDPNASAFAHFLPKSRVILPSVLLTCAVALGLPRAVLAQEDSDAALVAEDQTLPAEAQQIAVLPATSDGLYDFKPLTEVDPRYKNLLELWKKRQYGPLIRQAPEIAATTRQPQVVQATLHLLAMAYQGNKDWANAEKTWQQLAQAGPFAQRARQHLADLALKRNDADQALAQLAAVASWHVSRDAATLQMARLELQRDQIGPARDALERIKPDLLTKNERALMLLLQGEVARRSGKNDLATKWYAAAWNLDEEPHSAVAGKQLKELDAAPSPADQIERILRRTESKASQIQGWLHEAEQITDEASGLRAYVHGALLAREKKTRLKAIELLKKAVENLSEPTQLARALYLLGDGLGKSGDNRGAIETLNKISTLAAMEDVKARALQRLHRLYNAVDQPGDAEFVLQKLLDQHPAANERELALWGIGWQRFLAGDYPAALKSFVQLEKDFGHLWTGAQQPWRAKAMYWQGRSLQQMQQSTAALDVWSQVATTYAQTYYGVICLDRIRELKPDLAAQIQGPPPSPADSNQPPLTLERVRVAKHQALDEAALLVRMGLGQEGEALLRTWLGRGLPRDGIHLLATLYELDGHRRAAYGVMQRHTRRAARPDNATASAWRQAFPQAFYSEASDAAQKADISRTLLYAIMRHESAFNPATVSKAGAYGLVQLLPSAAKSIAELYKLPVPGKGGLLKAAPNLQIGALYLSQLLSFYRNNQAAAAAAYNAGPYAVQGWMKKWGHLPTDAFVESMPFPQTRAYVMQVTATAQTYAWLYPEWGEIERDTLARSPTLPRTLGPFMQRPAEKSVTLSN